MAGDRNCDLLHKERRVPVKAYIFISGKTSAHERFDGLLIIVQLRDAENHFILTVEQTCCGTEHFNIVSSFTQCQYPLCSASLEFKTLVVCGNVN